MQGLNRIFIMGLLGNDPQMYTTRSGRPFAGLSVATHRPSLPTEEGGAKDTTDWHFIRVWGKQGENCTKYLSKGQGVLVEGYLTQYVQTKEDGEGEKKTGITAVRVEFLPRASALQEPN